LQLFTFISADLDAYRPKPQSSTPSLAGPSSIDVVSPDEPRFPKSLYLIQPLFSDYELNPVALHAQASVPVPEGLDLDAWIVQPPQEESHHEERKAKKVKKGKGKELNGKKAKGKRREIEQEELGGDPNVLAPAEPEYQTAEEIAERERVSYFLSTSSLTFADLEVTAKSREAGSTSR
jgi:AP-3 complex subunit delta-1